MAGPEMSASVDKQRKAEALPGLFVVERRSMEGLNDTAMRNRLIARLTCIRRL